MLASDSDAYYAPPDGDRESYVQFVANLPTGDTVGLFGLHANAKISFEKQARDI